jgi:hypothetical protein
MRSAWQQRFAIAFFDYVRLCVNLGWLSLALWEFAWSLRATTLI